MAAANQKTAYVHKKGDAEVGSLMASSDISSSGPANAVGSPASGTGITVNYNGQIRRGSFQIKVDFTAFQAAALTKDIVLAVLPAKARLISVISDTTVAFAGTAGTLAIVVGKTAGGAEYVASHDVKTAVVTKGLADADLGTAMLRAAAVQGGDVPSWSATTNLQCRLTSGTGNLSGLTAGSVTFTFFLEFMG